MRIFLVLCLSFITVRSINFTEKTVLDTTKPAFLTKVNDNAQCVKDLFAIVGEVIALVKDINIKDWGKTVEELLALGQELYEVVKCFQQDWTMKINDVIQKALEFMSMAGDRKQCVLDHLKVVVTDVENAFKDALAGDFDKLVEDIQKAIDEVNDAVNNC